MFKYDTLKEQVVPLRNECEMLRAENEKLSANVDYIAMMTDVDIEEETDEQEV